MRAQLFVESSDFFKTTKKPAGSLSVVVFATLREATGDTQSEATGMMSALSGFEVGSLSSGGIEGDSDTSHHMNDSSYHTPQKGRHDLSFSCDTTDLTEV